jgi:hypothetical protein
MEHVFSETKRSKAQQQVKTSAQKLDGIFTLNATIS